MNAVAFGAALGGMPKRKCGRAYGTPGGSAEPPTHRTIGPVATFLIDPENVLYDTTLWRRWLHQVLSRMANPAPFSEFFEAWDGHFRLPVDLGRREFWEAFRDFLANQGLSESQTIEVLAAAMCRKRRFESEKRRLPGAKETLTRLAASGIAIFVLTNASQRCEEMMWELDRLGFRNIFRGALTSRDLGHAMPSATSYQKAIQRLQLDTETTAFLGSRANVLQGAKRCGIRTIAFNADGEAGADLVLENLADLMIGAAPSARGKLAG